MLDRPTLDDTTQSDATPRWIRGEDLLRTELEWLEPDGLGGFASGTPCGIATRRYHGLLCVAQTPPTGRRMLVKDLEAWVEVGGRTFALSSHQYDPGIVHPDGLQRLVGFTHEPHPTWRYELEDGTVIEQALVVPRGLAEVHLVWRLVGERRSTKLSVRPFLAARDVHALRREDATLDGGAAFVEGGVRWQPLASEPAVRALSNGRFVPQPLWYRNFLYAEERARGYDHREDLLAPGTFEHDLAEGELELVFAAELDPSAARFTLERARRARLQELARRAGQTPLDRAAEAYLVKRGEGLSIVAGYPWFTDWGRDTFLSLRGLLLARGKFADAARILSAWAPHVSRGMLPNRFPDQSEEPEYNSVDASLWFVVAVEETLAGAHGLDLFERSALETAVLAILDGYSTGTRYGIRADRDALLACGEPGTQLTWMDAKVDGEVMTPRIGKPVEIQALWIQALGYGAKLAPRFAELERRARTSFEPRFWNDSVGHLNDVVDCDHVPGTVDASLRPNQLLALGGLSRPLLTGERARRIVDLVERELWTPLGLRTLPRTDPRYVPHYEGAPLARDRAYHQGTAWPWLLGPFVDAWITASGSTENARREAHARFLLPLEQRLTTAGLGHLAEIADGDWPHPPRGCPFQAWSLGEYLRVARRQDAR
jgi:predicted glycogen debranching enzyme